MKSRYDRITYAAFIDSYYEKNELRVRNIDYEVYMKDMDELERSFEKEKEVEKDKRDWFCLFESSKLNISSSFSQLY